MKYLKEILKSTCISIGMALVIFCAIGIYFDVRYNGNFSLANYQFTKMVVACLVIGLGFGVPSFVYDVESIPRPMQVVLHLGIGLIVYTTTSYLVGWLGSIHTPVQFFLLLGGQILLAVLIWVGFLLFYRKEAHLLNEKLQSKK